MAISYQYESFWAFNDDVYPCKCCAAPHAMENGLWVCSTGKEWTIVEPGFISWADQVYEDEQKILQAETLEQKQRRLNKIAAEEALKSLSIMSYEMKTHADLMAIKSRIGIKKNETSRKIQRPCKWLYCDESAPKSMWRKNSEGKLCAPMTSDVKSSCWAYEYVDPKTKKKMTPHTCCYLHPGEEGWCSEWATNKLFNPNGSAVQNRFASLRA
jgi:hypothetical protein